MPATIRFVVTAGPLDGRGHLGRALSLAEARWADGIELELELLAGELTDRDRARAAAAGLREVTGGTQPEPGTVAVVDVPEPNAVAARFDPARLAVFDDRDGFRGSAALVIQPSQAVWHGPGEAGAVLAGYAHLPISAAIRARRSSVDRSLVDRGRPRLFMCFGGSDPARVTGRLAPALASLDADVDVVVGASYAGPTEGWPITVRRDPPDLVERLATADLALLAAGTMKFEAAYLGRPMLLVAVADDQLTVGPAFAATGAARYLGDGRTMDPAAVVEAVTGLLVDRAARSELGVRAARVVDGDGADRIAAAVERLLQPAGRS